MAITGTGTQADPYVVTTYAELVEKAAESGKYVKIGNDINITDEYPDGDMPMLTLANHIDGDGKIIANWYKTTGSDYLIQVNSGGQVENLKFRNIYNTYASYEFRFTGANSNYHFINCEFSGIHGYTGGMFMSAPSSSGSKNNFKSCSFNIKVNSAYGFANGSEAYAGLKDCYLKIQLPANNNGIFGSMNSSSFSGTFVDSCYIESNAKIGSDIIKNSVCDITTNATFTLDGDSTNLSIFNKTHAPNVTAGSGFAAVTDENWLDVSYLNSIGFNAG